MTFLLMTFFIIWGIVRVVKAFSPDKKNMSKVIKERNEIPSFVLRAKPLSTGWKILNFSFDSNSELQEFSYNNGEITLKMKGGKCLSGHLSNFTVEFAKLNGGLIYVTVKKAGKKIEFYQMSKLFTDDEWDLIFRTLSLASTTYGTRIFSKWEKGLGTTMSIMKLLQKIS